MSRSRITITVSGPPKSGKTRLIEALDRFFGEHGMEDVDLTEEDEDRRLRYSEVSTHELLDIRHDIHYAEKSVRDESLLDLEDIDEYLDDACQ